MRKGLFHPSELYHYPPTTGGRLVGWYRAFNITARLVKGSRLIRVED